MFNLRFSVPSITIIMGQGVKCTRDWNTLWDPDLNGGDCIIPPFRWEGGEWINFLETQHVGNTGMGSGWGQGRHMLGIVTVHCYQLQMGRGEHCFGIESSLKLRVFIICICGEWNKLNSLQEISDVVSHRNFQQRLMHYENSSTPFPRFSLTNESVFWLIHSFYGSQLSRQMEKKSKLSP